MRAESGAERRVSESARRLGAKSVHCTRQVTRERGAWPRKMRRCARRGGGRERARRGRLKTNPKRRGSRARALRLTPRQLLPATRRRRCPATRAKARQKRRGQKQRRATGMQGLRRACPSAWRRARGAGWPRARARPCGAQRPGPQLQPCGTPAQRAGHCAYLNARAASVAARRPAVAVRAAEAQEAAHSLRHHSAEKEEHDEGDDLRKRGRMSKPAGEGGGRKLGEPAPRVRVAVQRSGARRTA